MRRRCCSRVLYVQTGMVLYRRDGDMYVCGIWRCVVGCVFFFSAVRESTEYRSRVSSV